VTGSVTVTNPASSPVPRQNVGGGAATLVGQPASKLVNLLCVSTNPCLTNNGNDVFSVPSGEALVITDVQWNSRLHHQQQMAFGLPDQPA
jgi:hypothetical protein